MRPPMRSLHALSEQVDGLRVLTNAGHLFLRRVPDPLVSVLEIGSTSPGGLQGTVGVFALHLGHSAS